MFFYDYYLVVRQQILPQNIWCLSLTRRFYPSHMMWHNLWPQTQNISADVNTFSFHVLNIADEAKFHFTEKTTFFPDYVEERNLVEFRRDTCVSVQLECNLCSFQLKTSLHHKEAKEMWICCWGTNSQGVLNLIATSSLTTSCLGALCQKGYSWKSSMSESRNLYKHCAEREYWISRRPAHPL